MHFCKPLYLFPFIWTICIFVHLSEPCVSLCANLNSLYVCISVNLCIFFHSSEPSVPLCIFLNHFSLSPVSISTCAVPFWVVSKCSYNPVFWFSAAFLYSFYKCASQLPSCLHEMWGTYIYSIHTFILCLLQRWLFLALVLQNNISVR